MAQEDRGAGPRVLEHLVTGSNTELGEESPAGTKSIALALSCPSRYGFPWLEGAGKYAAAHTAPFLIDAAAARALADFLPERTKFLDGEASNLLIPYRNFKGELIAWPDSSLRKLMSDLSKASGVHVSLQEFRATFGQRAIDSGASLQSVSRCMRHKTTVTTERYYARMRPDDAMEEVLGVLNRLVKVAPRNPVSIDSES